MLDQIIGLPLIVTMFVIFLVIDRNDLLYFMTISILALNALSCRRAPKEKILFLIFNITFFFFLVGRSLIALILPEIEAVAPRPNFAIETEQLMNVLVFSSILVIRLMFTLKFRSITNLGPKKESNIYVSEVRRLSRKFIYMLIVPNLMVIGERIAFVSKNGYEAYYVQFTSEFSVILSRFASLYEPMLFLYLATFPTRRATYPHLLLYIVISALSLGYGQRNGFALSLVFAVIYLALRDVLTPERTPWISRKMALLTGQLLVPLIIFFSAFTFYRSDIAIVDSSINILIANFFISQGSAVFNLGHTIELQDIFPTGRLYSLGPIINFLRDNIFSSILFDVTVFTKASRELALEGYNFSFSLAYLINPEYYYLGGGYGSNFIAEIWTDFGFIGVIVGSAIYGLLMARFTPWLWQRGPIFIAFTFAGALNLIYAPRAEFFGFLTPTLSISTMLAYILVHLTAHNVARRAASGRKIFMINNRNGSSGRSKYETEESSFYRSMPVETRGRYRL
jgi:oligosaccharide repeat unit polymerase